MVSKIGELMRHAVRHRDIVTVHAGDVVAVRDIEGVVEGMDDALIALVAQKDHPIIAGGNGCTNSIGVIRRTVKIGRASCRESVCQYGSISVVAVSLKKKKKK